MAIATKSLINILEKTITQLEQTKDYQWGHMGSCNCGHLVQAITGQSKAEIHNIAMMTEGDWSEKAEKFCFESGLPIDKIIAKILSVGFEIEDIQHIEYLSHPKITSRLINTSFRHRRNSIDDVKLYFKAWIEELKETKSHIDNWSPKVSRKEVIIYDSVPEYEPA